MMKRIVLMTVAFLATLTAVAQSAKGTWSLRPAIGGTFSNLYGKDADDTDIIAGLAGGVELGYQISPAIGVSLGAYLMQQGCQKTIKNGEVRDGNGRIFLTESITTTVRSLYLNVPMLANFYVTKGLALKTGLQIGWVVKADNTTKTLGVSVEEDALKAYKTLDFGLPVGVSYEYEKVVFDVRYNIGLVNIAKTDYIIGGRHYHDENNHFRNGSLLLTLGYRFDL